MTLLYHVSTVGVKLALDYDVGKSSPRGPHGVSMAASFSDGTAVVAVADKA
jgi:hypothetical protein